MSETIVTKLTIANMGCNPSNAKVKQEKVPMARIFGVAGGAKAKTLPNGDPSHAVTGQFEGINLESGEVYRSSVLYLPNGIQEMLLEPLKADPDRSIEFAIEITAIPAKNPIGYSYEVKQLYKPEAADPLEKMRNHAVALPAAEKPKALSKAS